VTFLQRGLDVVTAALFVHLSIPSEIATYAATLHKEVGEQVDGKAF